MQKTKLYYLKAQKKSFFKAGIFYYLWQPHYGGRYLYKKKLWQKQPKAKL